MKLNYEPTTDAPGTSAMKGTDMITTEAIDTAILAAEAELGATIGYPALVYGAKEEPMPEPFYGARGKPATLRRAISDAINTYIAYECETDVGSERAWELATNYMFSEYGLEDGALIEDAAPDVMDIVTLLGEPLRQDDAGPSEYDANLDWALAQIATLRAELASARGHVAALVAAREQERAADDAMISAMLRGALDWQQIGDAAEETHTQADTTAAAARAWLRGGA